MKLRHLAVSILISVGLLAGCRGAGGMVPAGFNSLSASAVPAMESTGYFPNCSSCPQTETASKATSRIPSTAWESASSAVSAAAYVPPLLHCAGQSAEVSPSFLDHAVFVGDSVTLKLKNYVTKQRKTEPGFFGTAAFLAAGGMGSGNALKPLGKDSIHPFYNGEKKLLEDSAAAMGAKRVYLMLGINDIAPYGVKGAAQNLEKLSLRFCTKIPGVKIYIQSATPMLADKQKKTLSNQNLERYNKLVSEFCEKDGWYFVDVASAMRDGTGALKREYCSDPNDLGLHFTDTACKVWIHYILTHTGG